MRKITAILFVFVLVFGMTARADEGMWLLSMIGKNYDDMKKQGFKLTPEDIYSVNQGCLKDAVVGLGKEGSPFWHFCTGEIVSDEGLMFTNHHCGYSMIQTHSTVEHDYLKDGFWAYSKSEELSNPGITASILVKIEDVTSEIEKSFTKDMTERDRTLALKKASKTIIDNAVAGTNYKAQVKDMFGGNQYFLLVYVIYQDVRLVGAPPSSMGKFGGDTDNWMWPRHTADFSMFRIYTAPDGSPAQYSKKNVPLKPKHFLPVSAKGIEDGDFAMVMGFPGTTNRYVTSYGLEEVMQVTNKLRYEIRDVKVNVLRKKMNADPKVKIQYASKYASCSNYWKYSNEQNKALAHLNTMGIKKDIESELCKWADSKGESKYRDALNALQKIYQSRRKQAEAKMYITEGLLGSELPYFAYGCRTLLMPLASKDIAEINSAVSDMRDPAAAFYKDYNPETERDLMKALFRKAYDEMEAKYYPEFFKTIQTKYKGDVEKYVDDAFSKSVFSTEAKFNAFLNKPSGSVFSKDPVLQMGNDIIDVYRKVYNEYNDLSVDLERNNRVFIEGVLAMNPSKNFAPDANSTIRLTYGNVKSYNPRDGVFYDYYTTLKGVMEKENPDSYEFIVPEKLKQLYKDKNFGNYVNKNGDVPTCFITNNDITGGNSGSPVINGNGELIGLAFDGNSEAMSGDIDFEENLQRCICLDVRYALFIIDKYANAQNLIKEMDIRR
ncbi:MAG: S46 family peptidase [Bacteroidales bacterium]|nr:S46 family peptidase [Bacteroidales bacterium]